MSETFSEREDVEMLLPWFVTGRLDAADRAKVDAFLAKDPAMRRQLDLLREEQAGTIAANEAVTLPRGVSVARGMDYVTANSPALQAKRAGAGVLDQIRGFFAMPTAKGVRYAAIAAAAVFAVQAVAIGSLWRGGDAGPGLASGPGRVVTEGTFANVQFKDGVALAAVGNALTALDMRIVEGPRANGWFTVRLGDTALSDAERTAKVTALRQRADIIQLVTVPPPK